MKIDNQEIKEEALNLAVDILKDIELSRMPMSNIALKTSRLARLINELEYEKIFEYEAGGYPSGPNGVSPPVWKLAEIAGRVYLDKDKVSKMSKKSLSAIENLLASNKIALELAADKNISISSANPNQYVPSPITNMRERNARISNINELSDQLADRQSFIYAYTKEVYYKLKFSTLTDQVWLRLKNKIDTYISEIIPDEANKLSAIYDSLNDDNPEKWATALTTCRRMLQAMADNLYPPTKKAKKKGKTTIKLGTEQYINRLMCYIEEKSTHETLDKITNSNLEYIGKRLDSIKDEACKGTHASVNKEEAERCFMHVYMIIGDILEIERQSRQKK